jgi:hypothetical protein
MHEPIEDTVSQRHASREHTNIHAGMQVHNFDQKLLFGFVIKLFPELVFYIFLECFANFHHTSGQRVYELGTAGIIGFSRRTG